MLQKLKVSEGNKVKFDRKRLETDEFDSLQIREIKAGLEEDLDVSLYADNRFLFLQMREIRKGLEAGVDVNWFADPEYDWFQMAEISLGLADGLDVSTYAKKKYGYLIMREIRKGLEENINLSVFAKKGYGTSVLRQIRKARERDILIEKYVLEGYSSDQLEQIWKGIAAGVEIEAYLNPMFSGSQMKEIRLGLQSGIDISEYASEDYNWMQMKEIRLGLEHEVAVFFYRDVNFSARQMKEIRLGLEENLNVCEYDSYQWSATDMRNKRMSQKLEIKPDEAAEYEELCIPEETVPAPVERKAIQVMTDEDEMRTVILLPNPGEGNAYTMTTVLSELRRQGIKRGISESRIKEILELGQYDEEIEVASGQECEDGKDGHYDFLFCTEVSNAPCILEDGSVDYQNSKHFEMVEKNQKLAVYRTATAGTYGYTVTGKLIAPKRGKELPRLRGGSIELLDDDCTYISLIEGRIVLSEYRISIYPTYTYNGDVTSSVGNIKFNGDIHVTGYVGAGVTLEATGDITINGNVEAAVIKAGGDVLIRSGVNGAGRGMIRAGNNISGKYFEKIYMYADNNIESNYILNCNSAAMGKIIVSGRKGAIVGGNSYAIYGIEAYSVGNEAGAKTHFDIGENTYFSNKAAELKKRKKEIQREVEVLKREMYKYQVLSEKGELNNFSVYQNLKMALSEKQQEMQEAAEKELDFQENRKKKNASLSVLGNAYPGCTVKIDKAKLYLGTQVTRVIFSKKENKVAIYCTFSKKYITSVGTVER